VQALLYTNLTTRKLSESPGGADFDWPELIEGDTLRLALRFTETLDEEDVEIEPDVRLVRASLGRIDARPTGGRWAIQIGTDSPEEGVNTTALLEFDASTAQVQAAVQTLLNSIDFSLTGPAPDAPSISIVREGGLEGEIEWNEIQALTVPPQFRGAYQIKRADTFAKSGLLSVGDGIEEIAEAIQPLADEDGQFNVTNPLTNVAHIEFAGAMGGIDQDPLIVEVVTAPPGDVTFDLNLATAEIANLLRSTPVVENLPLEIEVTYAGADESEPLRVWTYRTEVTLRRELIHDELATVRNIDWLRPPLPADYVPFTPDQVITGNQHYVTSFGDGGSTTFVIDHHLGTEAIHLTLRENSAAGSILRPGIDYDAVIHTKDSVTVILMGAIASPPPASNSLAAVVTSAGPKSAFQAHHHTIAQILGLQVILDAFGADIAQLKALAPAGALVSQNKDVGFTTSWTLPKLLLKGFSFWSPPAHESPVGVGWWGLLKGFSFWSPPAHESPVGVGWWGFNAPPGGPDAGGLPASVAGAEGSRPDERATAPRGHRHHGSNRTGDPRCNPRRRARSLRAGAAAAFPLQEERGGDCPLATGGLAPGAPLHPPPVAGSLALPPVADGRVRRAHRRTIGHAG
jgi:hypothetical protein